MNIDITFNNIIIMANKKQEEQDNSSEEKITKKQRERRIPRLRGMRDILFEEYKYWELALRKADDLAKTFGFSKMDTPILERADLYQKSTGTDTDIVSKEMYEFTDKNGEKVALRPEATPGLVRSYIEHGMFNLPQPVKMFWLGPIFRHEKPQSGRYRQSHQLDLEIMGDDNPAADFLMLMMAYDFFSELQVGVQIQINSIGCGECQQNYIEELKKYFRKKRSQLCSDCKKRLNKNPLRLLDCKEEKCQELAQDAPPIVDYLCETCQNNFTKILEYLDELDIPYNLNPQLVRGLDYYTGPVFEFWAIDDNGEIVENAPALGAGGRYDNLIENMGGKPTPACGMGIGMERTINRIKQNDIPVNEEEEDVVFLAQLGDHARRKMLSLFEEFRKSGFKVRQSFSKDSLKNQLEEADQVGAKFSLILGQKEVNDNTILLRDMESGNQEVVDYKKVRNELEKRLYNNNHNNNK